MAIFLPSKFWFHTNWSDIYAHISTGITWNLTSLPFGLKSPRKKNTTPGIKYAMIQEFQFPKLNISETFRKTSAILCFRKAIHQIPPLNKKWVRGWLAMLELAEGTWLICSWWTQRNVQKIVTKGWLLETYLLFETWRSMGQRPGNNKQNYDLRVLKHIRDLRQ